MKDLTTKQRIIFEFIKEFIEENNYSPSIRDIAKGVGLSSTATVHTHLKNLSDKGIITIDPTKSRSIYITSSTEIPTSNNINILTVPNLGVVTAGDPIIAIEQPDEYIDIPSFLAPSNAEVFTLTVKGDSMINIGVYDGDTAIIEKTSNVRNGDHVVAMTEDFEVTLKTFYKEQNGYRLQPENDNLDPIYVKDVQVIGKLIGLYRKY